MASRAPHHGGAKHWCLTVFDNEEAAWLNSAPVNCLYWSYQQEVCPGTDRVHWQVYLGFEKKMTFVALKKIFPTAHVEVAMKPSKAFAYALKEESRLEGGVTGRSKQGPPEQGEAAGGKKRPEAEALAEYFEDGGHLKEAKRKYIGMWSRSPAAMLRIFEECSPSVKIPDVPPEVVILWGPPGTGKSSTAKLMFGDEPYFRLTIGKWADGYMYEKNIFLDDMSPNLVPRAQLLVLMESGWARWEVKGGTQMVIASKVIITSNYNPLEWFPGADKEDKEKMHERGMAVVRRATVMFVGPDGVEAAPPPPHFLGNTIPESVRTNQQTILKFLAK